MNIGNYLWLVIVVMFFASCGAPKVITSSKDNAETADELGNFTQAVEAWKQYFNQQQIEETEGLDYANAAKTAFKAGESDLAINWFNQARYKEYSDAEMYSILAKIYQSKNNISKELTALEYYIENFGENSSEINNRLFEVYSEIEANEKALEIWQKLSNANKSKVANLNSYFLIQQELNDTVVCDSVSLVLLEKNPEQGEALEWNAKKYYWLGENRYQREMEKYNKKKTTRQYNALLKELDLVTADFKRSLPYFEKLWKMDPGEKYASYFANIYARFNEEKKAKYYQKYLK